MTGLTVGVGEADAVGGHVAPEDPRGQKCVVGVDLIHGVQLLGHLPGLGLEPDQQAEADIRQLLGGGEADGGDVVGLVGPVGVVGVEALGGVVRVDGARAGSVRQIQPAPDFRRPQVLPSRSWASSTMV